jgi:hypothetical protein
MQGFDTFSTILIRYTGKYFSNSHFHRQSAKVGLARHSSPMLTANIYGRTPNERLAEVTEIVADRILLDQQTGANLVYDTMNAPIYNNDNSLENRVLTNKEINWRRGDSNPRPEIFQDKLLHA